MTPEQLAETVAAAVAAAVDAGELAVALPETVTVERPKDRAHGDYATNVALRLAKEAGRPPRAVAELLATRLGAADGIASVDVAGPGFLNIRLAAGAAGELVRKILDAGERYGRSDAFAGQRVNLEFVSANPTGPLHLGHTRWAAVGDALARILTAAGATVTREFYVNDAGSQMDKFGESLMLRAHGRPVPEGLYEGAYVKDLAEQIVAEDPALTALPEEEKTQAFRAAGQRLQFRLQ